MVFIFLKTEVCCCLFKISNFEAFKGVYAQLVDLLGVAVGNVLDGHAAFGGVNEGRGCGCTIESQGKV